MMMPSEFACQVMNRDLWRDVEVKSVVQQNFLFMQLNSGSPEGQKFVNFYPVESYPHISIIDPRTGERVKSWNVQLSPADFLMEVTDFLDANSLSDWSASGPPPPKKPKSKTVSEMSEEEQLNAALAASMESSEENELVEAAMRESEKLAEASKLQPQQPPEAEGVDGVIAQVNVEPPAGDANATRIQIRNSADGTRQVRRFYKCDSIRSLFAFIKASVTEEPFDLKFHRESLALKLDQTISDAGLENASITIEAIG